MKVNGFATYIKTAAKTVLFMSAFTAALVVCTAGARQVRADKLRPEFYSTDGSACTAISDGDYFTTEYFDPGTQITVSTSDAIDSLYIVWENVPGEWTLTVGGTDYTFGQDGYLHEYVKIPDSARGAAEAVLTVDSQRLTIADIYVFSEGTLPDYVQIWEPEWDRADVLLIPTHADDEVIFFGGIIPDYADRGDVRIQVAYFSDMFQTESYRNHEILNGLWKMGITHYPQFGEFYDYYSESLEEAQEQFDHAASLDYIVRTIRKFRPQVLIGQDMINGEYGHGGHMWCSEIIAEALQITGNEDSNADSAKLYGVWDVPKTYFHLYPENVIELDARKPLSAFGGKTALEVAKEAYLEHKSQQWTWFYVSDGYDEEGNPDGYEYSCTKYGLYRSLAGDDFSGDDILDNIITYNEQERRAAAQESAERSADLENTADETLAQAVKASMEDGTKEDGTDIVQKPSASSVVDDSRITAIPGGKNTTAITICIILAVIILAIIIGILVLSRMKKQEKERIRREKIRRMQQKKRMSTESANRNEMRYDSRYTQKAQPLTGRQSSDKTQASDRQARRVSRSSNGTYRSSNNWRR